MSSEWLTKTLAESDGTPSSMRVLVAYILGVYMIGWAYVCYRTGLLPVVDWQQLMIVIGPLLAKAWQKGKEDSADA